MGEIVVTPSGPGAMEAGLMIDDSGERFVVLTFREPAGDPVLVTFTVPLFERFAAYLATVDEAARDPRNWEVTPS